MKTRHKAWLLGATSAVALAAAGAVNAQSAEPPPIHYNLDQRGVDLVSGSWHPMMPSLSIGPAETGLFYGRIRSSNGLWWDLAQGGMQTCGMGIDCIVSVDGISEAFEQPGTPMVFVAKENTGSTLVYNSTTDAYTYTRSDGTVYQMDAIGTSDTPVVGRVTERISPNGLKTTYNYKTEEVCSIFDENEECIRTGTEARLQSYTTNTGYQIHYEYESDTGPDDPYWHVSNKVTAINLAVDYCAPLATSCTLTRTWPSLEYSYDDSQTGIADEVVEDQSGHEMRYRYPISGDSRGPIFSVLENGDVRIEILWDEDGGLELTDASGTWEYAFTDAGSVRTTTVEGPLGQELVVESDLTIGRPTSVTQATGPSTDRTWEYAYDDGRVDTVTNPEGDSVEYTYDARGNVTEVRRIAKPGSGLADIVTTAAYASTCSNPVTCNLPTSTTDARGQVTDYTWDSTHGGLLTVTQPAPSGGAARPQTRVTYADRYARFKNSGGTIVAAATPVTMPIEVSACTSGSSCDGAANEVLTTIVYETTTGVATNLQPIQVQRGSGTNAAMAVTAMTYTPDGDIHTIDGPLAGTDDTTRYRYDSRRRMVGVVGPDPDGSGNPGLNRAQRITYGEHDEVLSTEVGTTAGYTDTNWTNFDPILKTAVTYDAFDRPIEVRQLSDANAVASVQQTTYDDAGRPSCVAVRMNPATWGSLPSSACTAATAGVHGADRIVQVTYDHAGRVASTTSAYGTSEAVTEAVTYTANGGTASLTDGEGNVSILEYDGFDRPLKLRYPNASGGGTSTTDYEQVSYDAYGRVSGVRNRAGDTTYFGYDNLYRTIAVNAPGSTPDISSGFDNLGRMTTTGNGTITVNTTWDALSRPVSESSSVIGAMEYQYDEAGRLTRIEWPDDFAAIYTHDLYGAITTIQQDPVSLSPSEVAAYSWNDLGQPVGMTRGSGGATTAWSYDAWGRLSSLAHNASGSSDDVTFGLSYNPAGQIIGRTVSDESYVYGASPTGTTSQTFDDLNRITNDGAAATSHDSRSNLTGIVGNTYGYDDLNRLTSASAGAGSSSFTFDPLDRLATSTVGGASTRRQYVGEQLVAEYNVGTGALTRRYIPGLGLDDVAVGYDGSGNRTWQLADERGSVVALAGSTGAVSNINTYDEYGVPGSANAGRFQYTGQQWLPEAGAYHYRARTYLPQAGRFLQSDPIGYAAGANLYAYVGADPVNLVDPFGLAPGYVCITETKPTDGIGPEPEPVTTCTLIRRVNGAAVTIAWGDIVFIGSPDAENVGTYIASPLMEQCEAAADRSRNSEGRVPRSWRESSRWHDAGAVALRGESALGGASFWEFMANWDTYVGEALGAAAAVNYTYNHRTGNSLPSRYGGSFLDERAGMGLAAREAVVRTAQYGATIEGNAFMDRAEALRTCRAAGVNLR